MAALATLVLATLAAAGPAAAEADPRWVWRTIETDHFRIHYYEGLGPIARRVAAIAEGTHERLEADLDWQPRRITHLAVLDNTDYSQGITYISALNHIRLWVVAPEDNSTLEDFDEWLTLLVTHEYTHLMHIDQTRGLPVLVNAIFGEVYHPMQYTPSWLTEGYAISNESHFTGGGRVRSTMYDMYLRMRVLEDNFLRLDQVTGGTREYPQGTTPYLYGQSFVYYLTRRFGRDVLRRLAREMSDDLIPYGLNRAFRRVMGHTAVELWRDWRRSLESGYRAQADLLSEQGLTENRPLTRLGERAATPRFSPDSETVYFYLSSEESASAIWSVDVASGERRRIAMTAGRTTLAASSDGRHLYLSRGERHRLVYQYYDIVRLDLETRAEERLTDGARANAVDVSRDGRQVTYAAYRGDASDLWVANSELGQRRRLIESEPAHQVYSPRLSPDGRRVAISRRLGRNRNIQLVDVEDGSIRSITQDGHIDSSPCYSPDGRWLLFSSDRTGVANLYAYDLENDRLLQVTNLLAGAYMPDVSPDGETIAFVGYTSHGFDIRVMPFDPDSFREPQPERDRHEPPENDFPMPRMRDRPHRPWASLAPRSWMLGLGQDAFGDALIFTTLSQDATATHLFAGTLTVGLERGDVTYDLSYEYAGLRPTFSIRHGRYVAPNSTFRLDAESVDFTQETYTVSGDMSWFLSRGNYSHRFWAGYEFRYSRSTTDLMAQTWDPSGRPPRFPTLGIQSGIRIGWSFSNARSSIRGISLEQGRTLRTAVSIYDPALGSDWNQFTFRYRWSEYILMPWRHHHVLALSLGGGISAGELRTNAFYLGGYPEQDMLTSLIDQAYYGGNHLRGYPPGIIGGAQYHMLNMEYRFPLWNPERGVQTLPVFLSHIWLAAFCDVGGAFADELNFDELLVGLGGEVLIRITVGYFLPFTFRIGYAYGFMDAGEHQVFAILGIPF